MSLPKIPDSYAINSWQDRTAPQSQMAVTAHFSSEQLQPFGFAQQRGSWFISPLVSAPSSNSRYPLCVE